MELDDQLFHDDAFDAYAWLEEAVIDRGGRVPELAVLVPQLTLLSQSLTASIHGTLHQLTLAGPQLQTQLDAMQRATAPLALQLDSVVYSADSGPSAAPSTGAARRKDDEEQDLQDLLELHEAKERLQSCSKALVEAARWEKNVRACAASIDGIAANERDEFGEKKSTTMSLADRVDEMHKSLEILKDMPGADDRKRTLDRLSSQIETFMKPKLDEYLQATQLPVAQVQFCRAVFTSIGRRDHVVQAYCRCRPAQIHRLWYSFSASESGSFASWLDTFYREVLRLIQRETDYAGDIFGADASRVLVTLVENTLAALKESFRDRLKKDFAVNELLRAYQTSCEFVTHIAKALRSCSVIVETIDVDESSNAAGLLDRDAADRVLVAVLAPYQTFFTHYDQFAGDSLARKLTSLVPRFSPAPPNESGGAGGTARDSDDDDFGAAAVDENVLEAYALRVEDASHALWTAVEDSVRVCYEFSAGAAFPDAVRVVSHAVEQLTQRLSAAMPAIRQIIGVGVGDKASSSAVERHGMLMADWGRFHSTLALLRACGTLESDLASVEARLSVRMREQVQRLFDTSHSGGGGDNAHRSSPQASHKRKQLQRRRSGSNVVSLSVLAAEPTKVATAIVMKWLKDEPEREKTLTEFVQDLIMPTDDQDIKLFAQAHTSLTRYTRQVQTLVYESVFAPIAHVLRTVPTNECWIKTPDASLGDLPTFSTLPQEYITMVADLLLSLLPQLEPFAESSSLQKAAAASHDANKVCAREWTALGQLLHLSRTELDACERIFEMASSSDNSEEDQNDDASEAATFVDIWTSAVASGTTAALLTAVCKIPSLSPLGAKQLDADIAYFQNVLNALSGGGSERNFLIVGLQTGLQIPHADYQQFVQELRKGEDSDNITEASTAARAVLCLHETLLSKRLHHHHAPAASANEPAVSTSQFY